MEKTVIVIGALLLFVGKARGITCHFCYHHVYTSSDASIQAWLQEISEYDSNCLKHGDDYVEVYEHTCLGYCIKETGTANLRIGTIEVDFEVAQRGCAPSDGYAGTCVPLTVSSLVSDYGFTIVSEDVEGCYCSTNYCNHGNNLHPKSAGLLLLWIAALAVIFG